MKTKVSPKEIANTVAQIYTKWRTGPHGIARNIGTTRQSLHAWRKTGTTSGNHDKLVKFLRDGPSTRNELIIKINLRIDIANPTDKTKSEIDSVILLLQNIKQRLI